jgi:cyanophycinase
MNKDPNSMNPKGRLIFIGSGTSDPCAEAGQKTDIHQFPPQLSELLPEQRNTRIEIIISGSGSEYREKYSAAWQRLGYSNLGFIHIQQEDHFNDYYARIFQAKVIVFADEDPKSCELLKKSEILKLLHNKYLHEEDFTIIGMNASSMYIPELLVNEKGICQGLGFIRNCIIDTKFNNGTRFKNLVRTIILQPQCLGVGLNNGMILVIEKGYKASCYGSSTIMMVNARNVNKKKIRKRTSVFMKNLKGHILTDGSVINLCNGDLIKDKQFHYNLNFTNRNTIQ